jgi:hypothetical protein
VIWIWIWIGGVWVWVEGFGGVFFFEFYRELEMFSCFEPWYFGIPAVFIFLIFCFF